MGIIKTVHHLLTISKRNNRTTVDDDGDLDLVMSMYNLLE